MSDQPDEGTETTLTLQTPGSCAKILMVAESAPVPFREDGEEVNEEVLDSIKRDIRAAALSLHEFLEPIFSKHAGEQPTADYHTALNNFILKWEEGLDLADTEEEGRNLFLHLCSHTAVLGKAKEEPWPPPYTQEDLENFVRDFMGNLIFIDRMIPPRDRGDMLSLVFMPLAMGCLRDRSLNEIKNVGMIYEYHSKALNKSINGLPMFTSFHIMNKEDTDRCLKAVEAKRKALEEIKV